MALRVFALAVNGLHDRVQLWKAFWDHKIMSSFCFNSYFGEENKNGLGRKIIIHQ